MLAKDKMAALCAHVVTDIAYSAHKVMTVQHSLEDGVISLDEARNQMTTLEQNFVPCGEEAANEMFLETLRSQIQELE